MSIEDEFSKALPIMVIFLLVVQFFVFGFSAALADIQGESFDPLPGTTLLALGANNLQLVLDGEWYRILASGFLHVDPFHLISNAIAIAICGGALERLGGSAWTLAVFVFGAIGGSIMILVFANPGSVTLGASGGVLAIAASLAVSSLRLSSAVRRSAIQLFAGYVLYCTFSLWLEGAPNISHLGHLGGAITGAGLALLEVNQWRNVRAGGEAAHGFNLLGWIALVLVLVTLVQMGLNFDPGRFSR